MGVSRLGIIYSCKPRRNDQTNLADVNQRLNTQFLSVSGNCRKIAGASGITHPIDVFSLNFFSNGEASLKVFFTTYFSSRG